MTAALVTGRTDSRVVVMSIQALFCDRIFTHEPAARKRWEYRRHPLPAGVHTVLAYRSCCPADQRGIVGRFDPGTQLQVTPSTVRRMAARHRLGEDDVLPSAGTTPHHLARYAGGWDASLWAIATDDPHLFASPVPIATFGWTVPPQGWRYAPEGWQGLLAQLEPPTERNVAAP